VADDVGHVHRELCRHRDLAVFVHGGRVGAARERHEAGRAERLLPVPIVLLLAQVPRGRRSKSF
jgi:hypothetical protein